MVNQETYAREARRILAQAGGLNARSMRLLAAAAQRHGIPIDAMAESMNSGSPPIAPATLSAPLSEPRDVGSEGTGNPQPIRTPVLPGPVVRPVLPAATPQSRLRPIAPPALRPAVPPTPNSPQSRPLDDEIDPAVQTLRRALSLGAIVLVGLVLGLASVWMIVTGLATPPAKTKPTAIVAAPKPTTANATSDGRTKPDPSRTPKASGEFFPTSPNALATNRPSSASTQVAASEPLPADAAPVALVRALQSSVEQLDTDKEQALQRFGTVTRRLGTAWPDLAPDQVASAQNSIVEFLYRGGPTPDLAARAASALAMGTEPLRAPLRTISQGQVLDSVWALGLVTRLTSERDLPADARSIIISAAGASAGQGPGTFAAGAASAISAWPVKLALGSSKGTLGSPAIDLWREWLRAVEAVSGTDQSTRTRFVMNGLEVLLTQGPESVDPTIVTALVRAVRWHADDESRPRLLLWFENGAISSSDLRAVTTALVGDSAAAGVDPTMVLALPADEPQRLELRDRYAAEWGLRDGPARDAIVLAWAAAAKSFLDQPDQPTPPVHQLARAVVLSRLSESATRIKGAQQHGVGDAIRDADKAIVALLSDAASTSPPRSLDENTSDGVWAIDYLSAEKNIPRRTELLAKLGTISSIGQVDAEVLAAEAFRGSPTALRQNAQSLAVKFALSPAMVNAALEQSVNIPRTIENDKLARTLSLATLPALRDPGWRAAVRRALVTRLLEMVAARGDHGLVDRLADLLSDSYRGRVAVGPAEAHSASSEKIAPEVAARIVRASWLRWAQALTPGASVLVTLDQIQRRSAGRSRLASGMIQEFAAEQVGTAELMAFVVAVEQPSSGTQVAAILERLGKARRSADHVFTQMLAAERAMIELWAIRLGVSLS